MTRPPSIPAGLWDAIPPNLRPAIAAVVAGLEARVAGGNVSHTSAGMYGGRVMPEDERDRSRWSR